MPRCSVVWDPEVETPFINYWVAGDSQARAILTEIANWVDANLAEDPGNQGQARPDLGARIVAVPLSGTPARASVTYEVWPEDRLVRVIRLTLRGA
jgi:hypothetical protein